MFKPIKSNHPSPSQILRSSPSKNLLPTTAAAADTGEDMSDSAGAGYMAEAVATIIICLSFFLNLISCCFNHRKMLAAIITLLTLIVADVILIVIAYKSHMLQSMSTNGVTMTAILTVPTLGAILSFWLRNPGPQDEDLAGALRRPVGATTFAICLVGASLIFFLYFLVFYWT